jgi:hypothetical protein
VVLSTSLLPGIGSGIKQEHCVILVANVNFYNASNIQEADGEVFFRKISKNCPDFDVI